MIVGSTITELDLIDPRAITLVECSTVSTTITLIPIDGLY